jgi:integrase
MPALWTFSRAGRRAKLRSGFWSTLGTNQASHLVFTVQDGGGYHPERFSREFERKQATYNRLHPTTPLSRLRLHDTRRTWVTLALAAGVHPKVVQ